jgi:hypothetical protein
LGTWSKTCWADCEKVWFFLDLIFMSVRILSFNAIHLVIRMMFHKGPVAAKLLSVRILSFNAIHLVIKKMFHKGPVAAKLLSEMAYFIFGYFSTKLGTSVDGHEIT